VVPAWSHVEKSAHRIHGVLASVGLDELVERADPPGTHSSGHGHRPPSLASC
jgi:hypothetical protein